MGLIERILEEGCTAVDIGTQSRKRTLEWISARAATAHSELDADSILDALQARERLGSTGLGEGVAIPHCRTNCAQIIAVFARLSEPVDFDAPDGENVDLVFALIVPEEETALHLTVLAHLSSVFGEAANLAALRAAPTAAALRAKLLESAPQEDA